MKLLQRLKNFFFPPPKRPLITSALIPSRIRIDWPIKVAVEYPAHPHGVGTRNLKVDSKGHVSRQSGDYFVVEMDEEPGVYVIVPRYVTTTVESRHILVREY